MMPSPSLLTRFHVDPAVRYALVMRFWQVPAGIVTTVMIALFFTEQTQGIYYTLLSLVGLQALADSGLLNVLMHVVSHEWSQLHLDNHGFVRGPRRIRRRIAAMVDFGLKWFLLAGSSLALIGSLIGVALFWYQDVAGVATPPLLTAMVMVGCSLGLSPLVATLEGCNQIDQVNRFRLMQAVSGSLVVWLALAIGANLWTPVFAVATQLFWECLLVFGKYGNLFRQLRRTEHGPFDWRREIWPLQWRIGLQSAARYLAFFPMIPTLFAWQGPAVAGRVGMTWSVLNNLLLVAYAWIRTRAPEFGRLIAGGRFPELARSFQIATFGSTVLLVAALTGFIVTLFAIRASHFDLAVGIANRFIDPGVAIWFAVAMVPLHLTQCFAIHLRSQKMDPIWRITVVMNLILAAAIFYAASQLGVAAIGFTMFVVFTTTMTLVGLRWKRYERMLTSRPTA